MRVRSVTRCQARRATARLERPLLSTWNARLGAGCKKIGKSSGVCVWAEFSLLLRWLLPLSVMTRRTGPCGGGVWTRVRFWEWRSPAGLVCVCGRRLLVWLSDLASRFRGRTILLTSSMLFVLVFVLRLVETLNGQTPESDPDPADRYRTRVWHSRARSRVLTCVGPL